MNLHHIGCWNVLLPVDISAKTTHALMKAAARNEWIFIWLTRRSVTRLELSIMKPVRMGIVIISTQHMGNVDMIQFHKDIVEKSNRTNCFEGFIR